MLRSAAVIFLVALFPSHGRAEPGIRSPTNVVGSAKSPASLPINGAEQLRHGTTPLHNFVTRGRAMIEAPQRGPSRRHCR